MLGWFLTAVPLAFACAALRRPFGRLSPLAAWTLTSGALAATLAAFAYCLHAIALA